MPMMEYSTSLKRDSYHLGRLCRRGTNCISCSAFATGGGAVLIIPASGIEISLAVNGMYLSGAYMQIDMFSPFTE
jgi:hypothetical protein